MKPVFATILIATCAQWASAAGLDDLENFIQSVKTGRADFTQVVTAPSKDGQPGRSKTSSGSFMFERPNRFQFSYHKPFAQRIVADGQTLWLYDEDLNQVTARAQSQALAATPAALIAAAPHLRALQQDFTLQEAPEQDGLQWVLATPKRQDGQLQSMRIGFKRAQPPDDKGASSLAALEIIDSFGQRSQLRFSNFERNPQLPAGSLRFTPPAGADLVRQ